MDLKDTVIMMDSSEYKERFRAEYFQLKIRIEGLSKMIIKYREGSLGFKPLTSLDVFERQLSSMKSYYKILEERALIEGISLEE